VTLRWGILGTGGIARQFTRDLLFTGHPVAAVGSRTRENAERFAALFEIGAREL
jgi:predicted dehydrogenase